MTDPVTTADKRVTSRKMRRAGTCSLAALLSAALSFPVMAGEGELTPSLEQGRKQLPRVVDRVSDVERPDPRAANDTRERLAVSGQTREATKMMSHSIERWEPRAAPDPSERLAVSGQTREATKMMSHSNERWEPHAAPDPSERLAVSGQTREATKMMSHSNERWEPHAAPDPSERLAVSGQTREATKMMSHSIADREKEPKREVPVIRTRAIPARYADAVCTIPPVLLDMDVDGEPVATAKIGSAPPADNKKSGAIVAIVADGYRADPIETFAPPAAKLRTAEELEEPAEIALHLVPVAMPPSVPLYRTGRFRLGKDGRLERVATISLPAAIPLYGGAANAGAADTKVESSQDRGDAANVAPPARAVRVRQVIASDDDLPQRSAPRSSFASMVRQPPLPPSLPPATPEPLPPVTRPEARAPVISPPAENDQVEFKPIGSTTVNITPSRGELPLDVAAARFALEPTIPQTMGYSRDGLETELDWEAPAFCHRPLYFEEVNLERHGYEVLFVQPALSAAHFFARVPQVPYLWLSEKQRVCNYTLGHYRPGSYAPYVWYYPRFSLTGAFLEGGLITGLMYAIP